MSPPEFIHRDVVDQIVEAMTAISWLATMSAIINEEAVVAGVSLKPVGDAIDITLGKLRGKFENLMSEQPQPPGR